MGLDLAKMDLRDALDLAILMEEEARQRYVQFSRMVGGRATGDAADVFRLMASYEEKHGSQLTSRRRSLFPDAPSRVTLDMLDDVEAPDHGQPRVFMSAHDAVEVAIRSEEKAWTFFDEALRQVRDPSVRELFTELRSEEEAHRALLAERLRTLPPGPDLTDAEADEPGSDAG